MPSSCRWACKADDYPAFLRSSSGSPTSAARWSRCRTRSRRSALVDEVTPRRRRSRAPATPILLRPDGTPARRHVRRRGLRARRAAQGPRARGRTRARRRRRRRRLGDRGLARRGGRRRARHCSTPTRRRRRGARRQAARRTIPASSVATGSKDPCRLRHRRQRDAARHEARRPAAGRVARIAPRPSSARW